LLVLMTRLIFNPRTAYPDVGDTIYIYPIFKTGIIGEQ
jgi:hypothetical protein